MKAIFSLAVLCFPLSGWAQVIMIGGGSNGSYTINGNGRISGGPAPLGQRSLNVGSLEASLRVDPGTSGPPGYISFSYSGRSTADITYFTRTFTDSVNQEIFGYEVLLEQQQPGSYLATFSKVSMTPKIAADVGQNWRDWSVRDVQLPEPKVVHDGDVLSVGLMADTASGFTMTDEITVRPNAPPVPIVARGVPVYNGAPPVSGRGPAPTVTGPAREFAASDAEMQIQRPRVTLNGDVQSTAAAASTISGSLVWLYLPGHGRYVLSLAPRPELKFKQAGEVRGGSAKFTLVNDTITIECPQTIAPGHAAYTLYVLYDPLWEPTSSRQKGQSAMGSVSAGELAQLEVQ